MLQPEVPEPTVAADPAAPDPTATGPAAGSGAEEDEDQSPNFATEAAEVTIPPAAAYAIGPEASVRQTAVRWIRLWRSERAEGVTIVRIDRRKWILLAPDGTVGEAAGEMAAAANTEVVPLEERPEGRSVTPQMQRTTSVVNLREAPDTDGSVVRTLPGDTLAVALYGEFGRFRSEAGQTSEWSYLVASANDHGWVQSDVLEDYDGCLPWPFRFLQNIPEERRNVLRNDTTWTKVRMRHEGRRRNGFLLMSRDRREGVSYVGVHRGGTMRRHACGIARSPVLEVQGFVEEGFVVDSESNAGESLLIIAWHPELEVGPNGTYTWQAYRLSGETPEVVWTEQLPSGLNLPGRLRARVQGGVFRRVDDGRQYFPLRVRHPDEADERLYTYDGTTFVNVN